MFSKWKYLFYIHDSIYAIKKQIKNGFGIYLFHPMIIYVLYVWLGQRDIQPWVLCIGIAAAAYLASDYLTRLLRRCRLGVLIGEK